MAADPTLVNELLDAIEELFIENRALWSSLKVMERFIPAHARGRIDLVVSAAKSDSTIRETVHQQLAEYRHQPLDDMIQGLLEIVAKDKKGH